ncbi:MAG: glycosyltransferase family 4 protein [Anaerolineae bacterium]|nr:glycosyltransferase family 4 protein [Anaerolineae bacterium]
MSSYTGFGGGERILVNLMDRLDPERYTLHLVVPGPGQFATAAESAGVTVHYLPFRGVTTWFVPAIWRQFPVAHKLRALVRKLKPDAIISNYHALPFAVPAGQAIRVPVIWYAIGWWFPVLPWQYAFFRQDVTQIVAASQSVRDRWLGDDSFMPPESIPVILPGVDEAYFQPGMDGSAIREQLNIGPDVPLVAMLARFQHVKGHDVFQDMILRLHEQIPEARFVVAGENVFGVRKDETYKQAILTNARENPVLNRCLTYLGFFADPRPVVAAADVVVCPSRFESLGMVHLESMAMGCPVVSMNNGGPAETILDGETGYLVPPEDPAALADRVLAILRDPALRARMGQAGRERVLTYFTAQGYAEQFSQLIESLI